MLQLFAKKKKKGFTLIELLVVIAIIGTLASIVLVSMGGARQSARDAVRKADMRQIVSAQQLYYNTVEHFYTCNGASADCGGEVTWPTSIGEFMVRTPLDPGTAGATPYVWLNNNAAPGDDQKFCVYATLEEIPPPPAPPGSYFYYAASHAGNFRCTTVPTLTNCCF